MAKYTKVCVILLALWLPLGCVGSAGPHGVVVNLGQATTKVCKGEPPTCIEITGAPMSEQTGNVVGGFLATVLRMLGMSYGVPAPAPPP